MKRARLIIATACFILSLFTLQAQESNYFIHTVSKGQTLYSISRMYQTTVKDIIDHNPECIEKLSIGQKIKIYQKQETPLAESADNNENAKWYAKKFDLGIPVIVSEWGFTKLTNSSPPYVQYLSRPVSTSIQSRGRLLTLKQRARLLRLRIILTM